ECFKCPARRDLGESAGGRRGLADVVVAPAGDGAVGLHPAGVIAPRGDLGEASGERRGLAGEVVAPADHLAKLCEAARVLSTGIQPGLRRKREPEDDAILTCEGHREAPTRGRAAARRALWP